MTRLDRHQQKEFQRKVMILGIAFIVLLTLLIGIGLKVILNLGTIVGPKDSASKDSSSQDQLFATLSIDQVPEATNSASFIISGSSTNLDEVAVLLNDKPVKTIDVTKEPNFTQEVMGLIKGKNKLQLKGRVANNKLIKETEAHTVFYSNDKPKLDISEPTDNSKIYKRDLKVAGSTNAGNSVKVNDRPVVIYSGGNFNATVQLNEGENKVKIDAQDNAGNIQTKALTITYQRDD